MTDLTNATRWVDELIETRLIGDDTLVIGALVETKRRVSAAGKVQRLISEVTAFRPPTAIASGLLALETKTDAGTLFDRLTLDLVPEGTRLGVLTELGATTTSLFSRSPGLSAPSPLEITLRAGYRRSLEALALVVEREGDAPYR